MSSRGYGAATVPDGTSHGRRRSRASISSRKRNSAALSSDGAERIVPTWWEKSLVHHPGVVMLVVFIAVATLSAAALGNFPKLSEGGFEARQSIIQQRMDAVKVLKQEGGKFADHGGGDRRRLIEADALEEQAFRQGQQFHIFWEAHDGNVLQQADLERMCKFERVQLPALPEWQQDCKKYQGKCMGVHSIVGQIFTPSSTTCVLKTNWRTVLSQLAKPSMFQNLTPAQMEALGVARGMFLDRTFDSVTRESKVARSFLSLSGNGNDGLKRLAKALNRVRPSLNLAPPDKGGAYNLRIYYRDDELFQASMFKDMKLVSVSIALVFLVIRLNVGSWFLAICGMLEILLSFPMAFFVWTNVLKMQFYNTLMGMSLFIILGIGADDIFVLADAWAQSEGQPPSISGSVETRFAWSYRRASGAMTTTSLTTFMAFVATAATPVPAIKSFGIFAALIVLFDFLLVITWFAAALMFYEAHFAGKGCCGCGSHAKEIERPEEGEDGHDMNAVADKDGGEQHNLRKVEQFFWNQSSALRSMAVCLLPFFVLLALGSLGVASKTLKSAELTPKMFPPYHDITKLIEATKNVFMEDQDTRKVEVQVVWGLSPTQPIDRTGIDINDNINLGKPVFDPSWKGKLVQMQNEIVKVCDGLETYKPVHHVSLISTKLVPSGGGQTGSAPLKIPQLYCELAVLRKYLTTRRPRRQFPVATGTELETALNEPAFQAFKQTEGDQAGLRLSKARTNLELSDDKSYIRAAWITVESTIPARELKITELKSWNAEWEAFIGAMGVSAFQTTDHWSWMATMATLFRSCAEGIGVSLALAAIVLLIANSNWITMLLAMTSIVGIMCASFGGMAAMGWQISILEAICLIIAVGMAVDYTVHLMHAYNDSPNASSFAKARDALTEVGVSVVGGAFTTMLAAAPLFTAEMLFFQRFGVFTMMMTILSLCYSVLFLMPFTMVSGPESQVDGRMTGDIKLLKYTLRCKKEENAAYSSVADDVEGGAAPSSTVARHQDTGREGTY